MNTAAKCCYSRLATA